MSDNSIESQGRTVEEAISEALLRLGARRDEVEIEVVAEPRSGLFGFLGSRYAKVKVTRKSGGRPRSRGRGGRARGRGRGRGAETTTKGDQPLEITAQDKPAQRKRSDRRPSGATSRKSETGRKGAPPAAKSGADGSDAPVRRRRSRRRKPAAKKVDAKQTPAKPSVAEQAAGTEPTKTLPAEKRRAEQHHAPAGDAGPAAANVKPDEDFQGTPQPATPVERTGAAEAVGRIVVADVKAADRATKAATVDAEKVPELLHDLTTRMMRLGDFVCRCEVVPGDYHLVKVVTDDRSARMLIGRHGATIDAVEHVVERMATQAQGERVRMNLDINNYRRKREATLIELTEQAIAEVRQTGREIHTDPLCARERRIVHLAVKQAKGMKSSTVASSDGKYVVLAIDDGVSADPDDGTDDETADRATGAGEAGDAEQAGNSHDMPNASSASAGGADRVAAEDDQTGGSDTERRADL